MQCPACGGKGSITAPFCSPSTCPWCEGEGEITEEKLKSFPGPPLSQGWRRICCGKAKTLPRKCVCAFQTWCPDHGTQCHGTHD